MYFQCVLLCAYIELLFHRNIYCNYNTWCNNESWQISFKISCFPGGLLTSFILFGDFFNVYYAVPTLNSSLSELFVTNITLACFKKSFLYHIFLEGQSHILQFSVISSRCLFMCLHLIPPYVNCFFLHKFKKCLSPESSQLTTKCLLMFHISVKALLQVVHCVYSHHCGRVCANINV